MEGVEGGVGLNLFVIRRRGLNDNEGIWRVMSGGFPSNTDHQRPNWLLKYVKIEKC